MENTTITVPEVSDDTETVETTIGTAVVETPRRLYNPTTDQYQDLTKLSEDGYCRKFLAMLYAQNGGVNTINLTWSPVNTFAKGLWEYKEGGEYHILKKRRAEYELDEIVMGDSDDE